MKKREGEWSSGEGVVCESGAWKQRCRGSSVRGHTWADSLHGQREGIRAEYFQRSKGVESPALQAAAGGEAHSCNEAAFQMKSLTKWKHSPP